MLQIIDVHKTYQPATPVLYGIDLTVTAGEIACLLGPSGCGKTTLLRIVAGLEQADRGRVLLDGQDLAPVPVHKRNFGLMFQEFALFPDKSVAQNVAFGLRMAGEPPGAIAARVAETLDLVNMEGYGGRTVFQLSGGERQRVALARSLAPRPRLLMLDEPLGSLDRALREELMVQLRAILKRLGLTALYVTHDQQEALAVADRVVVMQAGRIAQIGAPRALYNAPATPFVATFLGFTNLLPATVEPGDPTHAHTALGALPLDVLTQRRRGAEEMRDGVAPGAYTLLIRPEALRLGARDGLPAFTGAVEESSFRGNATRVELLVQAAGGATRLVFAAPPDAALASGDALTFHLDPATCALLPPA